MEKDVYRGSTSGPLVSNPTQGEGRTPSRCSLRAHLGGGGDLRGTVGANPRKEVCRIRLGAFSSGSVIHTIPYHTILPSYHNIGYILTAIIFSCEFVFQEKAKVQEQMDKGKTDVEVSVMKMCC